MALREIVLALRRASKRYPGVLALSDVSLELFAGEVVGLLGENGAGKSTLVKILSGATAPSAGEIVMAGKPVSFASPTDALRAGIATVFQEGMLVPNLTVAANLLLRPGTGSGRLVRPPAPAAPARARGAGDPAVRVRPRPRTISWPT